MNTKQEAKLRAEKYFGISFEEIVLVKHLKEKISLNELSKLCGVTRQSLANIAKRLGLKTRSIKESNVLTKNKGENHFNFGKTKENDEHCKRSSDRMKNKNPIRNPDTRAKASASLAEYFKKNPLKQEAAFSRILKSRDIDFAFQYPIGPYVVDFFIPEKNLCIEIDSCDKWDAKKRRRADLKDIELNNKGFTVVRINRHKVSKKDIILDILKSNNII